MTEIIQMNETLKSINARLDSIDGRLNKVDNRLDSIDKRLETIDDLALATKTGFDEVHQKIDELESKFKLEVEFWFTNLSNRIDNITLAYIPRREHGILKERVEKVERKIGIKYIPTNP